MTPPDWQKMTGWRQAGRHQRTLVTPDRSKSEMERIERDSLARIIARRLSRGEGIHAMTLAEFKLLDEKIKLADQAEADQLADQLAQLDDRK